MGPTAINVNGTISGSSESGYYLTVDSLDGINGGMSVAGPGLTGTMSNGYANLFTVESMDTSNNQVALSTSFSGAYAGNYTFTQTPGTSSHPSGWAGCQCGPQPPLTPTLIVSGVTACCQAISEFYAYTFSGATGGAFALQPGNPSATPPMAFDGETWTLQSSV